MLTLNKIKYSLVNKINLFAAFSLLMAGFLVAALLCASSPTQAAQQSKSSKSKKSNTVQTFGSRRPVQQFIWDMHLKHQFNAWDLTKLFKTISTDQKVLDAISRPFEEMPWAKYRERFVTDARAQAGAEFWKKNEAALKKAEKTYGVPAEMIVAIIGVETFYGQNTGNFPVLQTLATLAFDYPARSQFFKSELEQYLLLMREEGFDPHTTMGSYAGAMGIPQFIPSSYRRFAVSLNDTGKRDLLTSPADAIGSVANYFKENGWVSNAKVAYKAKAFGAEYQRLANTNMKEVKPKLPLREYAQFNIVPQDKNILQRNPDQLAAFLMLKNADNTDDNWLTLQNFYVITRYNKSVNYAMAVFQLSERIRALHKGV